MKRKLSPGGGRTIYNKFPKARQKASVEALKEGGMKKDRLASGYKARRKDPRSLVKAGVEAFKKKRVKKMGGGMMGRRMGYSKGSNGKPISRSKNPGVLAMSKTAKGRKVVKEKFKFNPDRVVARKGGIKKTCR